MRSYISTIIFTLFLLVGMPVSAQIPTGDFVQIEQIPEFPRSNQTVTLNIKSSSTDIQNSTITWIVNGTQQGKGKGLSTVTVQTGKPGSSTNVSVTIVTPQGITAQKTLAVRPADVDLVWETDGFTPPFYKGRPGFSYQSELKLIAIPDFYTSTGTRIDPKTLVYTWKQDSTILGSKSGYGKDSLVVQGGAIAKPTSISVEVSSAQSSLKGQMGLEFEASEPFVIFYEESPLYGTMYNKALGGVYSMKESEATFVAVPYNFSAKALNNDSVSYLWSINNRERTDLGNARSITLRTREDVEGVSLVGLSLKNNANIFQSAANNFTVRFTRQESSEESFEF